MSSVRTRLPGSRELTDRVVSLDDSGKFDEHDRRNVHQHEE